MSKIWFYAVKGGQGTTVVAASYALLRAKNSGGNVAMADLGGDVVSVMGGECDEVTIVDDVAAADVVDGGQTPPPADFDGEAILVTRSCYVALSRYIGSGQAADAVVLVAEDGRALRADDVANIVNVPILATVFVDPAIARAVDAGLLTSRMPSALSTLGNLSI